VAEGCHDFTWIPREVNHDTHCRRPRHGNRAAAGKLARAIPKKLSDEGYPTVMVSKSPSISSSGPAVKGVSSGLFEEVP
jgi:hypothetical protein